MKITVPGPFTMGQQAQDDLYGDGEARRRLRRCGERGDQGPVAAGADVVELDER